VIALLAVLGWAVIRPRGWPEAVVAVPAAVILIAAGAIPAATALTEGGTRVRGLRSWKRCQLPSCSRLPPAGSGTGANGSKFTVRPNGPW
jgi:hypothetical protein